MAPSSALTFKLAHRPAAARRLIRPRHLGGAARFLARRTAWAATSRREGRRGAHRRARGHAWYGYERDPTARTDRRLEVRWRRAEQAPVQEQRLAGRAAALPPRLASSRTPRRPPSQCGGLVHPQQPFPSCVRDGQSHLADPPTAPRPSPPALNRSSPTVSAAAQRPNAAARRWDLKSGCTPLRRRRRADA